MATKHLVTTSGTGLSWATALNWSDGVVPASSDTVTVGNSSGTFTTGLNQAAVTLTSLTVPISFTGTLGSTQNATKSVTSITRSSSTATATVTSHGYSNGDSVDISGAVETEYNGTFTISNVATNTFDYTVSGTPSTPATGTIVVRKSDELHISATNWSVGDPTNVPTQSNGSGLIKFDMAAVQVTGRVIATSSANTETGKEPLIWKGTHASNKLYVFGGTVGVATNRPGDAATLTELAVDGTAAKCNVGAGTTLATLRMKNGTGNLAAAATTIKQDGGTLNTSGSGAITTWTITAGTANANSTGTVTTAEVFDGAVLDMTGSSRARTITTLKLHAGATFRYDPEVVTITNAIQIIDGSLEDVTIITPAVVNVTIAAA